MNGNERGEAARLDDLIDVEPTKALFVEMLTRDLAIDRAILDLVDNCIDGAKRLRGDDALDGLWIEVRIGPEEFQISDNCGGFSIEAAREYAFKFGRPRTAPVTPHSIGQFGIGMKRALFKFGRWFEVASTTATERFRVSVDVDRWEAEREWHFRFEECERGLEIPETETGTIIVVRHLRESVSQEFALDNNRRDWGSAIEAAQQQFIDRGLRLTFDGRALVASPWQLFQGEGILPSFSEENIERDGPPIVLRIYAGIEKSDPRAAGWYVLCNGRMVLEADQSPITGWSYAAEARDFAVPKYHNQFARFRGFAFFDCQDPARLPWNTTKTGVDRDSPVYRYGFQRIVSVMRPVIDFLNELDAENDNLPEDRPLSRAVARARSVALRDIDPQPFSRPQPGDRNTRMLIKVQYQRERARVDSLREALAANSAKEVGERSFELAYQRYVVDEDATSE